MCVSSGAETIYVTIPDTFMRPNIIISKVYGQYYDRIATMFGTKSGVAKRLHAVELRAVFSHCNVWSLVKFGWFIKRCKLMWDAVDITHEITKLIKKSPAYDANFKQHREEIQSSD